MKYLYLALIFTLSAKAEEGSYCPDPDALSEQVFMCGDNAEAAAAAQRCAEKLRSDWKEAARALDPILKSLGVGKNQKHSEIITQANYTAALNSLNQQIEALQEGAELIADYALVMVDFPDAENEQTSAPCFNSAFNKVQDTVNGLDSDIVAAKKARDQLTKIRELAASYSDHLDASVNDGMVKEKSPLHDVPGSAAGRRQPRQQSDISGTHEEKK